jgi:energy-coupling factor transporter ATP-binding protein EcfA2
MTRNSDFHIYSSPWIDEVKRELMRRRHVLLHGNVHDRFLCDGKYMSVLDILFHSVFDGFEIVVKYDAIDEYKYADPDAMQSLFGSVVRSAITKLHGIPGTADVAKPVNAGSEELAFGQIRTAVSQTTISVGAIIDLSDMLTRESASLDKDERKLIMRLKKCTLDAAIIDKGPKIGFRNTLVLMGGDLKRIPDWLYLDNPYIGLVQIDRPDKEERKQFALGLTRASDLERRVSDGETISEGLRYSSLQPDGSSDFSPELFAELTAGMQTMELEALRLTSNNLPVGVPFGKLQPLIDYFKFGIQDDPWEKLDAEKVKGASRRLSKSVIGQSKAVEAVVAMLTRARVGLSMSASRSSGKPKGIFFFVGPTGVGKTELAKAITGLVFGDEKAFARFDMSEYQQEHSAEKLCGAPPGFVGHEQGGQLTDRVRRHPHSILLFDEIEKAHPRVLDKFLQILEDGRLTDGKGDTAYFNQTAIIFTSNIGATSIPSLPKAESTLSATTATDALPKYDQVEAHFKEKVKDYFTEIGRSELRSRLGDNIVVFDLLRSDHIKAICNKFLERMEKVAKDKFSLTLKFDVSIEEMVLKEMNDPDKMRLGGRQIGTTLETNVELKLNTHIFLNYPDLSKLRGKTLRIGIKNKQLEVECG